MSDKRLYDLEDIDDFVEVFYQVVLQREADPEGRALYGELLRSGKLSREQLLTDVLDSPEGQIRVRQKYPPELALIDPVEVYPAESFLPYVAPEPFAGPTLCELTAADKWLDPEWRALLPELGLTDQLRAVHRKCFEWAQTIYGMRLLGKLADDCRCLGVGSGHEAILYWLANHVGHVVATDLYEGEWVSEGAQEGDPSVLEEPWKYAPFEYRRDRLEFLRMDGTTLEFDDDAFDVVFSLGSIEHFGGNDAAARAMAEMARVCRPDGLVVLATELILNDRQHEEFFTLDELREHIVAGSGMQLVQAPTFRVPRYALEHPSQMPAETHRLPHIVVDFDGVLTTSVILFLRHPA